MRVCDLGNNNALSVIYYHGSFHGHTFAQWRSVHQTPVLCAHESEPAGKTEERGDTKPQHLPSNNTDLLSLHEICFTGGNEAGNRTSVGNRASKSSVTPQTNSLPFSVDTISNKNLQ